MDECESCCGCGGCVGDNVGRVRGKALSDEVEVWIDGRWVDGPAVGCGGADDGESDGWGRLSGDVNQLPITGDDGGH